ncbi:MAG: N-acetylmuramoyl-L-alanine amidase [Candidatus Pacebacteria bacterium]|nr:N-acetylmuramoyl-L-alanine amidase [Candidatus Paceibacterota bacterium]
MNKPIYLIVHHTGGTDANPLADTSHHTAKMVDEFHKSKGWDGIGYNWFIEKDGKLVKGRDENKTGAHTIGYNDKSIGICLAGNFDTTLPTKEQTETLRKLLLEKMVQYSIPKENIVPHRKFASKTCFGRKLVDTWAMELTEKSKPVENSEARAKKAEMKLEAIRKILEV